MKSIYLAFVFVFVLAACQSPQKKVQKQKASENIGYAKGFRIEKTQHYNKLVLLNPWNAYKPYASYYFLKDSVAPPSAGDEPVFYFTHSPQVIALHSAAQAYALGVLGLKEKVKGITDPRFFYDPYYVERLQSGELIQTANPTSINREKLLMLQPDLVILSGWSTISTDNQQLIQMGTPPLFMMEWMEPEPLGRAEWIKVLGLAFNKEQQADSIFRSIEKNYLELKNKYKNTTKKPSILHGEEYGGVWYVAGGKSFMAQIYADAGTNYLWKENDEPGSLKLDVEVVLEKAAQADFWFTTFGDNPQDIAYLNQQKYAVLKATQTGNIYSNTKRVQKLGGNDFWETGNIRPDLILHDIVKITHSNAFPNDSLFFYKKLSLKTP